MLKIKQIHGIKNVKSPVKFLWCGKGRLERDSVLSFICLQQLMYDVTGYDWHSERVVQPCHGHGAFPKSSQIGLNGLMQSQAIHLPCTSPFSLQHIPSLYISVSIYPSIVVCHQMFRNLYFYFAFFILSTHTVFIYSLPISLSLSVSFTFSLNHTNSKENHPQILKGYQWLAD